MDEVTIARIMNSLQLWSKTENLTKQREVGPVIRYLCRVHALALRQITLCANVALHVAGALLFTSKYLE